MLLIGWWLYCIGPGRLVFRFQNVIAQLGVTYLLAYAVMRRRVVVQLVFSLGLLVLAELLCRFFPLAGFDQAFVAGENFGAWFNILIAGSEDGGHWAMFNAVPTAAHTIWGVLAGQLLLSGVADRRKLRNLVLAGVLALLLGYGLRRSEGIALKTADIRLRVTCCMYSGASSTVRVLYRWPRVVKKDTNATGRLR